MELLLTLRVHEITTAAWGGGGGGSSYFKPVSHSMGKREFLFSLSLIIGVHCEIRIFIIFTTSNTCR